MDPMLLLLRVVHIVAGILWVGGSAFLFLFVERAAKGLGPQAEPFMTRLVTVQKMPIYFMVTGGLSILAGLALFWRDSAGDRVGWIARDGTGLTFGIGGLAALIAFGVGLFGIRPTVEEMGKAGAAMKSAGGPPTPEMVGRMHAAQERLERFSQISFVLLVVTIVTMAIARYV